jgi:hypothetical protein
MQIDSSNEHSENAEPSIRESREPDANVTIDRLWHPKKQLSPSRSTEEGMQIDESSAQYENANSSIRERFDPLSKITCRTSSQ